MVLCTTLRPLRMRKRFVALLRFLLPWKVDKECFKMYLKYKSLATHHWHAPDAVVDVCGHIATSLAAVVAVRRIDVEFTHFAACIRGRNDAWNVG